MRALVTAGGTEERIDDVRVLTNLSTGRLGLEIARALARNGVEVVLLAGPALQRSAPRDLPGILLRPFSTFVDLSTAIEDTRSQPFDLVFMAAAVSDYTPEAASGKMSSERASRSVQLVKNPKLLSGLRAQFGSEATIIGFKLVAATSPDQAAAIARDQVVANNLDACFLNHVEAVSSTEHPASLFLRDGSHKRLAGSKRQVALDLVDTLLPAPKTQRPRFQAWSSRLADVQEQGLWRTLRTLKPTGPVTAIADGRPRVLACGNDYLGLAWHPDVRSAATGTGAGSSRLICGNHTIHEALEEAVEAWFGKPALVFPSGYQANLAVFSTVCGAHDHIASDALNHASIIDGLRLAAARKTVVAHADPSAIPADVDLVAVEGLFSMDGDRPDLKAYPRRPWLAVDEAHAVGCIGPNGRGVAAEQDVDPDIVIGTFGKAFGAAGAFVCGPPALKDLLINRARSFIYTTAPPAPVLHMAMAALKAANDDLRQQLQTNVSRLRGHLNQLGWPTTGHDHIIPIVAGAGAARLAQQLWDHDIVAPVIRWPTVARGQERLRLTVSAAHSHEQLDRIADALGPASQ